MRGNIIWLKSGAVPEKLQKFFHLKNFRPLTGTPKHYCHYQVSFVYGTLAQLIISPDNIHYLHSLQIEKIHYENCWSKRYYLWWNFMSTSNENSKSRKFSACKHSIIINSRVINSLRQDDGFQNDVFLNCFIFSFSVSCF